MDDKDKLINLFNESSQDVREGAYKIYGCSQQNFNWILRNATKKTTILKAIESLEKATKNSKL